MNMENLNAFNKQEQEKQKVRDELKAAFELLRKWGLKREDLDYTTKAMERDGILPSGEKIPPGMISGLLDENPTTST